MWSGITVPKGINLIPISTWVKIWDLEDNDVGQSAARKRLVEHALGYSEGITGQLCTCGFICITGEASPYSGSCVLEVTPRVQKLHGFKKYVLWSATGQMKGRVVEFEDAAAARAAYSAAT